MRGRCVENARRGIAKFVGQRHRFASGVVGQAEHDEIHVCHKRLSRRGILPLCRIDALDDET